MVDLIVFEIVDFYMILELEFLGRYKAKTDWQRKKVWFSLDNKDQFKFNEG